MAAGVISHLLTSETVLICADDQDNAVFKHLEAAVKMHGDQPMMSTDAIVDVFKTQIETRRDIFTYRYIIIQKGTFEVVYRSPPA